MVELLAKCLKQPESQPELYHFVEDCFLHLDESADAVMANFPLFFALHLPAFLGFRIDDNYSGHATYLDLREGNFVADQPRHPHFLEDKQALVTSQLLKVMQPEELGEIPLHHEFRRNLLQAYETYYVLHISDFGRLKTLPVLREILA